MLAAAAKALGQSPHGVLVLKRCRVQQFLDAEGDWEAAEQSAAKKRGLFADILGDEEPGAAAGRKRPRGFGEDEAEEGGGLGSVRTVLFIYVPEIFLVET